LYAKNSTSKKATQGFLRPNNIITQFSSKLDNCKRNSKSLVVMPGKGKQNIMITRHNSSVQVKEIVSSVTEFRMSAANIVDLYDHHSYLVNGSDFYEKMNEFLNPTETTLLDDSGSSNFFDPDVVYIENEQGNAFSEAGSLISNLMSRIVEKSLFKAFFIIFLFVSLCFVYFILRQRKYRYKNQKIDLDVQKAEADEALVNFV
jgi:hypothetical protein